MTEEPEILPREIKDRYIGDGVYLSWDGFQIWIAVNHHQNKVAALPYECVDGLIAFMKDVGFINTIKPN